MFQILLIISVLTAVWQVPLLTGQLERIPIYDPEKSMLRCSASLPQESLKGCDVNSIRNESQHAKNEGVFLSRIYVCLTTQINYFRSRVTKLSLIIGDSLIKTFEIDCYDYYKNGRNETGPYNVSLSQSGIRQKTVWCEMSTDGGGWMVIQARRYTSQIFFNRIWREYKLGFGMLGGETWFGLEDLHTWTNTKLYELRIDLVDTEERTAYAKYDLFSVEGENDGYKLHVRGYSGTAGNALGDEWETNHRSSNDMKFSTVDKDNDNSGRNCADDLEGGWWYNDCSQAKLNSPFVMSENYEVGVKWLTWTKMPLSQVTMMIRPSRNNPNTSFPNIDFEL